MKCDKKDLLLYAVTDRYWLNGETLIRSQVEESTGRWSYIYSATREKI